MKRYLAIAVALHIPLLFLRLREVAPESAREPIEVTTAMPAPTPPPGPRVAAEKRHGGAKAPGVGPTAPQLRGTIGESVEQSAAEAKMQNAPAYTFVYRSIDEQLDYPTELRDSQHEGVVKAYLTFTPDGVLHRKVEASDDYLRVLVHRVLRDAFRSPLPQKFRGTLRIACTFEFELVHQVAVNDHWDTHPRPAVMTDHFAFYRSYNLLKGYGVKLAPTADGHVMIGGTVDMSESVESLFGDPGTRQAENVDPLEKYRHDPEW